jgi:ATP-binding cassette, subfamily B, bacterial
MEAMERLMEGRTTFMITHRLDTLNTCNLILHVEDGELTEVVRDYDVNFLIQKKREYLNQVRKAAVSQKEPDLIKEEIK